MGARGAPRGLLDVRLLELVTRLTGHAPFLVVPEVQPTMDHYRDVLGFGQPQE